ncbi:unnamed protein product [Allacma fusca]|uniref:Uncharacterized protein n=1 Tax=Allacma fusca TaxID=39272 RepID=A0A8J2L0Y1_9HEXA|nr:unnamed protein product [Allacma fusca]
MRVSSSFLPEILTFLQLILNSECISPPFLWSTINTTIVRKTPVKDGDWNPSQCPRIVFHNNETLVAERELLGSKVVTIDLSSVNKPNFTFPNLFLAKQFLQHENNHTIANWAEPSSSGVKRTRRLYEPCVTVVSVVNATDMNFDKMWISGQLSQLLQYNTPVRNRHLILVRLAKEYDELFNCNTFKGSSDFPTRKMPLWEMLLFDFFTDAKVIQGLAVEHENKAKNTLKVANDPGLWVWVCNDIIEVLERKKQCLANTVEEESCGVWNSGNDHRNSMCFGGYSPRH